jgi:hypothetical protein
VFVNRVTVALDQEAISPAHRLDRAGVQLSVGELGQFERSERETQHFGDFFSERNIGTP